jgi:hypothetical protein
MWQHGVRRALRSGRPTRLGTIGQHADPVSLAHYASEPEHMGIVPPYTRDWGQFQTFQRGNYWPGTGFDQGQYHYLNQAVRHDRPGTASFRQLRGGAISQQVGAVQQAGILTRLKAAWMSTTGG